MFKNKKSQLIVVKIMLAIIVFIFAIILIPGYKESFDNTRNASNLNCTNPNLSAVNNATCIVLDVGMFWVVSVLIGLSLALLSGKSNLKGVLTTIFVFVFVVVIITPLKDFIVIARDAAHLNCAGTISVGARMLCIFTDLWLFYFVVLAIAAAITMIFEKKVAPRLGI